MKILKQTKIVATIGPATETEEVLTKLVRAGLDVARFNMSHGTHEEHLKRFLAVRKVSQSTGKPLAILQDLSGPKIRIGEFSTPTIELIPGEKFTITTDDIIGDENRVSVNYKKLPQELKRGSIILLDDGKKKLEVIEITKTDVICLVVVGGTTKGRRGMNLPGAYLSVASITEKDRVDVVFGVENKADFVALSFVRQAKDIFELRDILKELNSDAQIVAKIETQEAIENIDEIISATDVVMVARGDLAIEIGPENVPPLQKKIIEKSRHLGKPVIVATQMLESMISSPVPTRAEVSDIANAIYDGTDAIMLSEETTLGKYPLESVETMARVAQKTEEDCRVDFGIKNALTVADVITSSIAFSSTTLHTKAIVALTESGGTARLIARHRGKKPIFVFVSSGRVANKMALSYGCIPIVAGNITDLNSGFKIIDSYLISEQGFAEGDRIVVAFGMPSGIVGSTNTLHIHTVSK
jgi:pyruvate kinase